MADEREETLEPTLSIGALSRATGVPVETLRTWERRYGFPDPHRNESGHREYDASCVERLRLVDRALAAGNRAANVVPLSVEELRELLAVSEAPAAVEPRDPHHDAVADWLVAARDFDGPRLDYLFRDAWMKLGPLSFLTERVSPFLFEVGAAWAERRLAVAQEHFASEQLRDFLVSHWRPLSDRANGSVVVCATLPGEAHSLGLHMIALVFALSGLRVIYLGPDSPVKDIATTARGQGAAAVAISISVAANRFVARRDLEDLREALDARIELLVGGLGSPRGIPGAKHIESLESLAGWAQAAR